MRSMFGILITTTALCAPALAADMPTKAPIYTEAKSTWGGFYIGPSVGYAFGDMKSTFEQEFKVDPKGFTGGGQAGINWQNGRLVAGVEVDIYLMNIKDRLTSAMCEGDCGIAGKYDLVGTARARVGIAALPSVLLYGTGGMAWGRSAIEVEGTSLGSTHFGWTAGGGIEAMLGRHWTARVQYLHLNFGNSTVAGVLPVKDTMNLLTFGVNFKF